MRHLPYNGAMPYPTTRGREAHIMCDSTCTCNMYDDGNGESGPHLCVEWDERCPQHGREAEPEKWGPVVDWYSESAMTGDRES